MSKMITRHHYGKMFALVGIVFGISAILTSSYPAVAVAESNINLKPWKLTLPVNSKGQLSGKADADEKKGIDLTSYTNSPWYIPTKTNGKVTSVKFYAVARGATTSSSGNPRSELREMTSDGKRENNWSPYKGTHRMLIKERVYALQGRRHVVIGQIHDKASDKIDDYAVFRLQGTQLWAYVDGSTSSGKSKLLDGNVKLNQVITVGFMVKNGTITMYYDAKGGSDPKLVHTVAYPKGSVGGAYFKAGSYCQCGAGKGYSGLSGVEILGLDVTHDGRLPNVGSAKPDVTGDAIPTKISEEGCQSADRKILTAGDGKKFCAKRNNTKAGASECVDHHKKGYAKFTYIVDASGDYCGYW